jgi:small subunit ribosomal protein S9
MSSLALGGDLRKEAERASLLHILSMAFLRLLRRPFAQVKPNQKPWRTHFRHEPIYPAETESKDPLITELLGKTHVDSRAYVKDLIRKRRQQQRLLNLNSTTPFILDKASRYEHQHDEVTKLELSSLLEAAGVSSLEELTSEHRPGQDPYKHILQDRRSQQKSGRGAANTGEESLKVEGLVDESLEDHSSVHVDDSDDQLEEIDFKEQDVENEDLLEEEEPEQEEAKQTDAEEEESEITNAEIDEILKDLPKATKFDLWGNEEIKNTDESEELSFSEEESESSEDTDLGLEPLAMSLVSKEMRDQVKAYFTNQDRLQDKSHLNQLKLKLLNSNPLRKLEREGQLDVKMLDLQERPPTLEGVLSKVDEILATADLKLKKAVERDISEANWHFKPRYLAQDQSFDDNAGTRAEQDLDVFPRMFDLSPRVPAETRSMVKRFVKELESEPFEVPFKQSTAVEAYSAMRGDEGYAHFLSNHLKYWRDAMSKENVTLDDLRVGSKFRFHSWERNISNSQERLRGPSKPKSLLDEQGRAHTSGKRKTAVALAWVSPGTGKVRVNHKSLIEYFDIVEHRERVILPFKMTGTAAEFNLNLKVMGGGVSGQAQAAQLAVSRALTKFFPEVKKDFDRHDMLKRDPRMVERKKTSKYKARKSYTFVKR